MGQPDDPGQLPVGSPGETRRAWSVATGPHPGCATMFLQEADLKANQKLRQSIWTVTAYVLCACGIRLSPENGGASCEDCGARNRPCTTGSVQSCAQRGDREFDSSRTRGSCLVCRFVKGDIRIRLGSSRHTPIKMRTKSHLKTPHFTKYKTGTQRMIKALKLVETDPIRLGAKPNSPG